MSEPRGLLELSSFHNLQEWADSHIMPVVDCQTDVEPTSLGFVLRGGVLPEPSMAVRFSSLELLRNLRKALVSGYLQVHPMMDGIHKISLRKWMLLAVGTTTIKNSDHPPTQSRKLNSFGH